MYADIQVFKKEPGAGQATVDNWVAVIVLICATIMNESAVDTLLNGITGTISSQVRWLQEARACSNVCTVLKRLHCAQTLALCSNVGTVCVCI